MRVLVIGSVVSTERVIEGLIRNGLKPVAILGYDYRKGGKNCPSGYVDLSVISKVNAILFKSFSKINDDKHLLWASNLNLDIIFAVGFSQLMSARWFSLSKHGCVGFHPTLLPKGRGRAPLAWLILERANGAASFFKMSAKADDGPIYVQREFAVEPSDSLKNVMDKMLVAIDAALDEWLPLLKAGINEPVEQVHSESTYFGMRKPKDGIVNWNLTRDEIYRLIKASIHPHPGAFTYFNNELVDIIDVNYELNVDIKGVCGRVLDKKDHNWLCVQCADLPLWIKYSKNSLNIGIGSDLNFDVKKALDEISLRITKLEQNYQK